MLKRIKPVTTAAIAALSLSAHADIDMFLQLDGIPGETRDETYSKGVDVLAWSWGMSQSGTMHVGTGGGAGKASFADITVTKYIDKSSVPLYRHSANGTPIDEATLTMRKVGDPAFVFEQLVMFNILVTSATMGGSGGEDRLTENITLNFEAFCVVYTEQTDTGGAGEKPSLCWNIAAVETCTLAQLDKLYQLPLVLSLPAKMKGELNPVCANT